MRSYRLGEKVKTLINQHFDIWLYKSQECTINKLLCSLSVNFACTDFLHMCLFSITEQILATWFI